MNLKQKLSELGISPEFLTGELVSSESCEAIAKYLAAQRKWQEHYAEHILKPWMNKVVLDLLPELPLGASIGNIQKRSFEYELIGGV